MLASPRFACVLGALLGTLSLAACSSDDSGESTTSTGGTSSNAGGSTASGGNVGSGGTASGGAGAGGAASGGNGGAGSGGASTVLGHIDLVPFYEAGSAWETNQAARTMVDTLFAEVESALRTSGDWDATIEVYLTDDDPVTANTYFLATPVVTVDGHEVIVVPAWQKIVLGAADENGPADTAGNGYDFGIDFNVTDHADNPGLLRHELMHGFGAVNGVPNPTMSASNALGDLVPGSWVGASLYDLALVDRQGNALLGTYDSSTQLFQVASYDIESTYSEWSDGDAGLSFRGIADDGGNYDMALETFPDGNDALLLLNEPSTLMSATAHPTWNHLAEPDRAYFRAMHYELAQ